MLRTRNLSFLYNLCEHLIKVMVAHCFLHLSRYNIFDWKAIFSYNKFMGNGQVLENSYSYTMLRWIMYALLPMPLLLWSVFLFPFITTKILYFRILVEIALVLYVALALKFPELRPRWNWLSGMVWIYFGVVILTSVFGVNFNHSFWGTVERGEGIITLLHFGFYFLMLPVVFRTKQDWTRYLAVAVMITVLTGLIGLVQLNCQTVTGPIREGFCGLVPPTQGARISATIGNASFFASFLLFGVFLSLYLAREVASLGARWFWYVVAVFNLFIIIETQTRGGAIAAYVGLFLFLVFSAFRAATRKKKTASAIAAMLMILGPVILFGKPGLLPDPIYNIPIVRRLATISTTDITTQSRLDTWQASFQSWKSRFLTGYGYENYNVAFNKNFPARIFKDSGSQIWFDRAHNIIFDVAVTSGILGLVAYLGIFAAAIGTLWRLYRSGQMPWQSPVILGLGLIAYFIQNIFVFDTQATYLMLFLVLGHIVFLSPSGRSPEGGGNHVNVIPEIRYVLTSAGLILTLVCFYLGNWKPARANIITTKGIFAAKTGQFRGVQPLFQKALSYGTYMDEEIRQRLVDYAHEAARSGQLSPQERNDLYRYVIEELQKSIKDSPRDVKNYIYLMNVFNSATRDKGALEDVIRIGEQALSLSKRQHVYFELGQAAFLMEDFERGLQYFRAAVVLYDYPRESHMNYLLGAIIAGRDEIVESELQQILDLGHAFNVNDYQSMARAYFQAGNKAKTIESYRKAVDLRPGNPDLWAQLAAAYGEVCDISNARSAVGEAVKLDAKFSSDAKEFISQLQEKCK